MLIPHDGDPTVAPLEGRFEGVERRLTVRLENYWLSLRWSPRGPFFQDFHPARNPVPWTNVFIAHVPTSPKEISFDHVGTAIISLFKPDRTNLRSEDWLPDTIASRFGNMRVALDLARLSRREDRFDRTNGDTVLYRSLLLPFVDCDRVPTYVVGAVTYRVEQRS